MRRLPVATVGSFFSIPWRQFPFPIAAGMLAHAARWALIAFAGANVATGAFVACILASSLRRSSTACICRS
jgi:uncharacterized membrane protein YjjB (DUF3815 family)